MIIYFNNPAYILILWSFYWRDLLKDERDWEADLVDLERQIDKKTKAIVIINPSNPCGSVYSKQHLLDIINLAEKYKLPIIADETYGDMVNQQ